MEFWCMALDHVLICPRCNFATAFSAGNHPPLPGIQCLKCGYIALADSDGLLPTPPTPDLVARLHDQDHGKEIVASVPKEPETTQVSRWGRPLDTVRLE